MKFFVTQKSARGKKFDMEFDDVGHFIEDVKQTAVFQIDTEAVLDSGELTLSPSIPKPNYVGDEDDEDLNKDR